MQGSWSWLNEAKPGAKQAKWGYLSSTVGDELTLRVRPSKRAAALPGFRAGNSRVLVGLGVLKSYTGMGAAALACSQGCSCASQVFELQHKPRVSRPTWCFQACAVQLLASAVQMRLPQFLEPCSRCWR